MADTQYQPGDGVHEILRKILERLNEGLSTSGGGGGGDVGSRTYAIIKETSFTPSTTQYTPFDVFGGVVELNNFFLPPGEGRDYSTAELRSICVYCSEGVASPELEFFFFKGEPTGTYTDNDEFSLTSNDANLLIARASILAADYLQIDTSYRTVAQIFDYRLILRSPSSTNLSTYVIPVVLNAPVFSSNQVVKVCFGLLQH